MAFGSSVKTHQGARDHRQQKADDDIGPGGKQRHLHHAFCNTTAVLMGENSFDLCAPLVPFMAEKFGKKFLLSSTVQRSSRAINGRLEADSESGDCLVVDAVLRNGSRVSFHLFLAQKQGELPDFACSVLRARVDFAVF